MTTGTLNLGDPELELIDPTPSVRALFLHFDKIFFWARLHSRCVVRWSKRMFSCAGVCSYDLRGGLCDIALSEPLLKLRPRKDMVETLLHEMIHAYLFVTNRDRDRDGHGPNFQAHMHRINRAANLNISIYHSFHLEVELYQTHWWRCDGPCQSRKPHFGIVRRSCNRAPGPNDYWWVSHQKNCGGKFIKIKEPDKTNKNGKKASVAKPNADITKYINNNNKDISNKNKIQNNKPTKPILKDTSNVISNPKGIQGIKTNNNSTFVINKKNVIFNPQVTKSKPVLFNGTGQKIGSKQPNDDENKKSISNDVIETVRNVWANKQITTNNTKPVPKKNNSMIASNPKKHKVDHPTESPPSKIKKIDDYFKTTATSMLKNLYGQDFDVTQSENDRKLKAIPTKSNFVACPVCNSNIVSSEINKHLDECLNKGIIEELSKESNPVVKKELDKNVKNTNSCRDNRSSSGEKTVIIISENEVNCKPNKIINKPEINNHIIDLECETDVNCQRSRKSYDPGDRPSKHQNNGKLRKSDSFIPSSTINKIQTSPILVDPPDHTEPGCSSSGTAKETICPCCSEKLNTTVNDHLDECLSFFENNTTIPEEGTIIIDSDFEDEFDESQIFNETGTKLPCPCCLVMIEQVDMTNHLLDCLGEGSQ